MTEYGMQSFPSINGVFTNEKDRSLDSDVMNDQKASLGTGNLMKYVEDYYQVTMI